MRIIKKTIITKYDSQKKITINNNYNIFKM